MNLPAKFAYLATEAGPKVLLEALKWLGVHEVPGLGNNPIIMDAAKAVGAASYYPSDATPWCALAMTYWVKQAGFPVARDPLAARSWATWGNPAPHNVPMLGDVLVYQRTGGGHVTLYVGESKDYYYCLGGNQGDSVCIVGFPKTRPVTVRRCPWKMAQPAGVRRIVLDGASVAVGASEA